MPVRKGISLKLLEENEIITLIPRNNARGLFSIIKSQGCFVLYSTMDTITGSRTTIPFNNYKTHKLALRVMRYITKVPSDGLLS